MTGEGKRVLLNTGLRLSERPFPRVTLHPVCFSFADFPPVCPSDVISCPPGVSASCCFRPRTRSAPRWFTRLPERLLVCRASRCPSPGSGPTSSSPGLSGISLGVSSEHCPPRGLFRYFACHM